MLSLGNLGLPDVATPVVVLAVVIVPAAVPLATLQFAAKPPGSAIRDAGTVGRRRPAFQRD